VPRRQKGGPAEGPLGALRECIARGLDATAEAREQVAIDLALVAAVAATVDAAGDPYDERVARYDVLLKEHEASDREMGQRLARQMKSWRAGLFLGAAVAEGWVDSQGRPYLPENNYELERWFRLAKGHARHVHGRAHAGIALVLRGATLLPALDAHRLHDAPFTAGDLRPYFGIPEPAEQTELRQRAHVMRKARSPKQRPLLLEQLESRYAALV
jgi:hypothetical protein